VTPLPTASQQALNPLHDVHPYPGALVVVEGIDGSGKSTQLKLLRRHLEAQGYALKFTEWNSSELVKDTMKMGKKKNLLTPTTFSLLHATDFADRYYYEILPALKAGMVVLADRYVYTAFARDAVRGVDPGWVRNLYRFAAKPDLALYFKVPIEVSLERLTSARANIKFHEAGMDLGLASNVIDSFRLFQSRVLEEYDRCVAEFGLQSIDAQGPIREQQEHVRSLAEKMLAAKPGVRKVVKR
jgi:dTMP kinase